MQSWQSCWNYHYPATRETLCSELVHEFVCIQNRLQKKEHSVITNRIPAAKNLQQLVGAIFHQLTKHPDHSPPKHWAEAWVVWDICLHGLVQTFQHNRNIVHVPFYSPFLSFFPQSRGLQVLFAIRLPAKILRFALIHWSLCFIFASVNHFLLDLSQ